MATVNKPILGPGTRLDGTANIYFLDASFYTTNDLFPHNLIVFTNSGTTTHVYGCFDVPNDYVGTAKLLIEWTSLTNTGVVRWGFSYKAVGGDDAESYDPAAADETVEQNDDAPSTSLYKLRLSIDLTSGNFAAGDIVGFDFYRESGDAADNHADSALLIKLFFQYANA